MRVPEAKGESGELARLKGVILEHITGPTGCTVEKMHGQLESASFGLCSTVV